MSTKQPNDFLKEAYARILVPETGGGFYAEILEFPGCYASGDTSEQAFKNLEEVALLWIESELEEGNQIPSPTSPQEFSGKFALRLPRSLHQQVARFAQREGTSLNQFIVSAIAEKVGASSCVQRITQQLEDLKRNVINSTRSMNWHKQPIATTASFETTMFDTGMTPIKSSGSIKDGLETEVMVINKADSLFLLGTGGPHG